MSEQSSNDGNRARILRLIETLRKITLAVQFVPYVYCTLYLASLVLSFFCSDMVKRICNIFVYASPIMVGAHLVYSKILHLCRRHKVACVIPLFPQMLNFLDGFLFTLPKELIVTMDALTIMVIASLLIHTIKKL